MTRTLSLLVATLLVTLTACGGGSGGGTTSGNGLIPLDFDVTTDPTSTVGADDVIGYAVSVTNPMYSEIEAAVPAGTKLASVLQFGPATPEGAGFSGDFAVRTTNRAISSFSYGKVTYKYKVEDDGFGGKRLIRDGSAAEHSTESGNFRFRLDYLGLVVLLEPTGSQFEAAAFADLSVAQFDTPINFWAVSRNGNPPVSFSWSFGDGATAVGQEVSHTYPTLGEYNVTVTATDAEGNVAPVASTAITILGNPALLTDVDVVVTENTDGSFDYNPTLNGGTPEFEYEWDLDGDGEIDSTERKPTFTPGTPGVYTFTLTVTDQTGAEASTTGVADSRKLLLAGDTLTGYAPHTMTFTLSTQGTGAQDSVEIDFADGTTGSPGTHTFTSPGVYAVVATATRIVNGVEVRKESNVVLVTVDPRPAPEIASATPARARVGDVVRLDGRFFFLPEVDDEVLLNGVPMPVVTWEPSFIEVTVPAGARDGDIVVHKGIGALDSNPYPFDVAPGTPGQPGLGQL